MAGSESTQARRAALLMYGLPPVARRKVMARLTVAEATRMRALIDELTALGVSPALGKTLSDLSTTVQDTAAATVQSVIERASRLAAEDVAQALRACAPATISQLLRSYEWPWERELLDCMAEAHRAEVLRHLRRDAPKLAPAILNSLCTGLCLRAGEARAARQLADAPKPTHIERGPRSIVSFLRRIFRWTR